MSYLRRTHSSNFKYQVLAAITAAGVLGFTTYDYSSTYAKQSKVKEKQHTVIRDSSQSSPVIVRSISADDAAAQIGSGSNQALSYAAAMSSSYREEGISRNELEKLIETLALNDDQTALVRAMFEGYRMGTEEGSSQTRESRGLLMPRDMSGFNDINNDQQTQAEFFESMKKRQKAQVKWRVERKQLETQFFNDVQLILDDKQTEIWPRYQQDYRRRSTLKKQAQIPSEGIDLIDLVQSLELSSDESARLKPSLEKYAEDLDRALSVRNHAIENLSENSGFMVIGDNNEDTDHESMFEMNQRVREKRQVLAEINIRYSRTLASSLGSTSSGKLTQEFDRRSFPRIFKPTKADRYIQEVRTLPDLTADQISWIDDIVKNFQTDLTNINNQLVTLQRKKQKEQARPRTRKDNEAGENGDSGIRIAMMSTTGDGNIIMSDDLSSEFQDDIHKANTRKYEIVINTIDDIYAILSDNQRADRDKPKVRKPTKGMFSFMDGMQIDMPAGESFGSIEMSFETLKLDIGDLINNIVEGIDGIEGINGEGVQVSIQRIINEDGEVEQEISIESVDVDAEENDDNDK